ncbi:acyltransferase [Chloroflexales bacterium ZM16-3]|nr:acyltransferase [Chloroflexales bacterium ZM16-3]
MRQRFKQGWVRFWMQRMGPGRAGRLASLLAGVFTPPYKGRVALAHRFERGYIAPSASVSHSRLQLGRHIFIGDRVVIYQRHNAGPVALGDYVELHRDVIIENGSGGSLSIGARTGVQPRCQFAAYVAPIMIGARVQIAPACAFYPYDHGMAPGIPMIEQPLTSRGPIVVDDDAWLGYGAVVLGGVRIGAGAVIGASAVVSRNIPAGAIAVGTPARVVKMRDELPTLAAAIAHAADQET